MKSGARVVSDSTKAVAAALRELTTKHLLVGVPQEKGARRPDGSEPINNAQIGYINENGSAAANIEPRPHLVPGVREISDRAADILAKGAAEALTGDQDAVEKSMNKAGLIAQASIRATITKGEGFRELSESTLAARKRKGFIGEKPLIFTGQYRNSINYVIRNR